MALCELPGTPNTPIRTAFSIRLNFSFSWQSIPLWIPTSQLRYGSLHLPESRFRRRGERSSRGHNGSEAECGLHGQVKSTESTRKLCFTTSHPSQPTTVQYKRTQTTFLYVAYQRRAETTCLEHVLTWLYGVVCVNYFSIHRMELHRQDVWPDEQDIGTWLVRNIELKSGFATLKAALNSF